jgi:hypothetical protein
LLLGGYSGRKCSLPPAQTNRYAKTIQGNFKMKTYGFKDSQQIYKTYFKSFTTTLLLLFLVVVRLFFSNAHFKNIFIISLLIIFPIIIILGLFGCFSYLNKKYIIGDHSIRVCHNKINEEYYYSKIIRIKCSANKEIKKTGMEFFTIYFNDNKKLNFVSLLPFYSDFKKSLKKSLVENQYYNNIAIFNDF